MVRKIVTVGKVKLVQRQLRAAPHIKGPPMRIRETLAGTTLARATVYFMPKEDKGRKPPRPIDLAWLGPKAREWADARVRIRLAQNCRCTGRCECA